MNNKKAIILAITTAALAIFIPVNLLTRFRLGGPISPSTEAKYIRNIHRYSNESFGLYVYSDTLTSISKVPFHFINPFYKYYIMDDVGLVPRSSKLSKMIDSIWSVKYLEMVNVNK